MSASLFLYQGSTFECALVLEYNQSCHPSSSKQILSIFDFNSNTVALKLPPPTQQNSQHSLSSPLLKQKIGENINKRGHVYIVMCPTPRTRTPHQLEWYITVYGVTWGWVVIPGHTAHHGTRSWIPVCRRFFLLQSTLTILTSDDRQC